jgi:F-type H+-transporting ATPase subunit delta
MTLQSIARRYALALFDVAEKRGHADQALRDLTAFDGLIQAHPDLRRAFETPAVPAQKKRAVVESLLAGDETISDEARRLLLMLAERDRLILVGGIVQALLTRVQLARRVFPADVTTAVPLGDQRKTALAAALGQATGGEVLLTEHVDPSIIGGVIAKVGTVVFDGSVIRQLERMRETLQRQA